MRCLALVTLLASLLTLTHIGDVSAQPANQAESAVALELRLVRESIDLEEYEVGRDKLLKGLASLTRAGSAVSPIAAELHALLGIVYIRGFRDTKKATEHFTTAIEIKKDVKLPKLAEERSKLVFGRVYEGLYPTIRCDQLMGLYHKNIGLAQQGSAAVVEAKLGKHLVGGAMLVMYRGAEGGAFKEASLERAEDCTYRGTIPAQSVNAPKVEYYLEARLKDGRPSARRGKAKSPYTVNVSFGAVAGAAAPPAVETAASAQPESHKPQARSDEVEDLLLTQPKEPRGSGCAGCNSGRGGTTAVGCALALLMLLGLRRRRHIS